MPSTYITIQGDTWDSIALSQLGSEKLCDKLMAANPDHRGTVFFIDGITLTMPEVESDAITQIPAPPWAE